MDNEEVEKMDEKNRWWLLVDLPLCVASVIPASVIGFIFAALQIGFEHGYARAYKWFSREYTK